jgi:lysophospholipase L1-like esterase
MGPRGHILTLAAGLLAGALAPTLAGADHACTAPPDTARLAQPLTRTAARLARHEPLTIVAIGSSSTFGAGATSPAASYPSRLAIELKNLFPKETITVINRGVNGEEVTDMLKRFADGVIKEKPDLVLWQVGTNSVLRDKPLGPHSPLLLEGIKRLKAAGADVVLIDPQYVPRVIAKADAEGMVRLIATTAKTADVDLIQRFAMMRWWHDQEHMDFSEFASPDNLHMNDWGYACLAKQISASIFEAATRNVTSASASARAILPVSARP